MLFIQREIPVRLQPHQSHVICYHIVLFIPSHDDSSTGGWSDSHPVTGLVLLCLSIGRDVELGKASLLGDKLERCKVIKALLRSGVCILCLRNAIRWSARTPGYGIHGAQWGEKLK